MEPTGPEDDKCRRVNKVAMATPNLNATAAFKAGMIDLENRMKAAGEGSCVSCFGGKQSLRSVSNVQMGGNRILRALSALSCISLKTSSSPTSSMRKSPREVQDVLRDVKVLEEKKKADQRVLLRIVMWGGPNTLLLLAPFDAPTEGVVEMVLDSYVNGVGLGECNDFELFCAHCNSPALHPKQPIGSVGSRHFLLCKKGPQISGLSNSFFNSHSQTSKPSISKHSHHSGSKHSHHSSQSLTSKHSHTHSFHSHPTKSFTHSRSLSHSSLSQSSVSQSHHKRSNSWWNPVQCLTVDQH